MLFSRLSSIVLIYAIVVNVVLSHGLHGDLFSVENDYIYVELNTNQHSIASVKGDFFGNGKASTNNNALSFPLAIQVDTDVDCEWSRSNIEFSSSSSDTAVLSSILSCGDVKVLSETWNLNINNTTRSMQLSISGSFLTDFTLYSLSYVYGTGSSSIYALFDRGVAQMMNNPDACLVSNDPISRWYAVGNNRSVEVKWTNLLDSNASVIVSTQHGGSASAVQHILIGNYSQYISRNYNLAWKKCTSFLKDSSFSLQNTSSVGKIVIENGFAWNWNVEITPNNYDFPAGVVNEIAKTPKLLGKNDLITYLIGVYASPAGCIKSYYDLWNGTIAPTIAHPDTGYSPDTNFFDPDNFMSISALLYSGDEYFIQQSKQILERTAATMCGIGSDVDSSYCDAKLYKNERKGQLMHHFVNLYPNYQSIATSTQLGPNIFWSLSVLQYISATGDREWLMNVMLPYLELSTDYILRLYDEEMGLLKVQGPLWIDVLVRENYTSDSNAAAVYLFEELAVLFDYVNGNSENSRSTQLRAIRSAIIKGLNEKLWSTEGDHYVTQVNPDGSIRDFVDYDANLLAVAFGGVEPADRIPAILTRVDSGPYTHVRGTWCSEIKYSGDADDCYIVGGDVCGDSVVTLGRIGWADSHARRVSGDVDTFLNLLLAPLQHDLLQYTWLYERYDQDGNQIRTPYYFEYPSLVTIMLFEVRYGVALRCNSVTVNPFPTLSDTESFQFSFGVLDIRYSKHSVSLIVPGDGELDKYFYIHSLIPNQTYEVVVASQSTNEITYQTQTSTNERGFLELKLPNIDRSKIVNISYNL